MGRSLSERRTSARFIAFNIVFDESSARNPEITNLYHLAAIGKAMDDPEIDYGLEKNLEKLERVLAPNFKASNDEEYQNSNLAVICKDIQICAGNILNEIEDMPATIYSFVIADLDLPSWFKHKAEAVDTMVEFFNRKDWARLVAKA